MEGLIYKNIIAAMRQAKVIGKDKTNNFQGWKFRGIDDVYNSLHDILVDNNLFTVTEVIEESSEDRKSSKGKTNIYRVLHVKYTVFTDDGSSVSGVVIGEGMDTGDKAANKAMAVAHKYFFLQLFAIPTEDMPDPDASTPEPSERMPKKLTAMQLKLLETAVKTHEVDIPAFMRYFKISRLLDLPDCEFDKALAMIGDKKPKPKPKPRPVELEGEIEPDGPDIGDESF